MNPVLLVIIISLLVVLVLKNWKPAKKSDPPGPPRLPFIGSYLHLLWTDYYRPFIALEKMSQHYKSPVISFVTGPYNVVVANDAASCREVFNGPHFQGRAPAYGAVARTYEKQYGFFNGDGDGWLHLRRNTLTAMRDFGFGRRSDKFEAVVEEELKSLVERLEAAKGGATLIPEAFFISMFSLIIYLVHGHRVQSSEHELMLKMGRAAKRSVTSSDSTGRLLSAWPWIRFISPTLSGSKEIVESAWEVEKIVRTALEQHKKDFDPDCVRDLMDYYLKNMDEHPYWSEDNLVIACTDLINPNASVTIVMASTLMFLLEHPEILKKCQKEIDDVVGRGRLPTLDDRQHLLMVEASIRETMRLYPLDPLGAPHKATEDATLCGYSVPKETVLITNIYTMMRDPAVFDDPNEFRPERLIINNTIRDPTLPFGLGKRVCAGETYSRQCMFVIIATILQNFDMEIAVPRNPDMKYGGFNLTHNPDMAVRFFPRA